MLDNAEPVPTPETLRLTAVPSGTTSGVAFMRMLWVCPSFTVSGSAGASTTLQFRASRSRAVTVTSPRIAVRFTSSISAPPESSA